MAGLELVVTREQAGRTVKSLLRGELGVSAGLMGRLKRTETGLTVNGARVFTSAVLREGDRLAVDLDAAERSARVEPAPMALDVLFEDEHLLVVNKPAPLACIPSSLVPGEPTLAAGLLYYLGEGASLHLVNRLDRGTTGVMAAAKNAYVHNLLRERLHTGALRRTYLAVCAGGPAEDAGRIDLPIGRDPTSAIRRRIDPAGKAAETAYRVLARRDGFSLVELTPRTGRTHQLRVHMAALGCPLAGDWLYGTEDRALIARPALHAARLDLVHPVTGERLSLEAPVPEDMAGLMDRQEAGGAAATSQQTEQDSYGRVDFSGSGVEHHILPQQIRGEGSLP